MPIEIPQQLIANFQKTHRVCVLTGAGISAESGIPTFREAQTGLWAKFEATELATPEAFRKNPKLVWDWYQWRRELCRKASPNHGHKSLVNLQRCCPNFTLVTQNVDGLHERAGSTDVIELHGNIMRSKCADTGRLLRGEVHELPENGESPPLHPETGGVLRPDVVWFNEQLPAENLRSAVEAAHQCDIFLSIGTSSLVYPAAALPFEALNSGATVVEINPTPTQLSSMATHCLRAPAGVALPALLKAAGIVN
ncbi:MAG: NAD-dependent deacylase [Planctomycetes bacterium]|nr:NAD-dependent deacylase [Planctomycetota bacterium]